MPSNVWGKLLPGNSRRWSLLLSAHPTTNWGFSFDPATKTQNQVILIPTQTQPLLLTRADFGSAIQDELWGIGSAVGITVAVVETFLLEQYDNEPPGTGYGASGRDPGGLRRNRPY